MSVRNLGGLLDPRSVVVIGASDRPGAVGTTVWNNLRSGGFDGPVWAVNPKHRRLDGDVTFARVADLPGVPDLAVVCTPPATVSEIIDQLGAFGTRAAIVVTAGLDAHQKQAMLEAARPTLLRVLGPNCLGLLTPRLGLNASFAHTHALAGNIAFLSQSGALVTAVLDWAKARRIGFSHMVSMGEHCDVDFGDLLDHLASDPHTRSILMYVESIESARKFMSAARAAARNKPVIVVKAGRAGKGMAAAASHTGALAGSDAVYDTAIRRAGMLRVDTLQDLFMAAETLARFRGQHGEALTIMTNGGGAGVMAADAAELSGLRLAELGGHVRQQLDAALPPTWSHANPIDIIGDAPVLRYTDTLQALLGDPSAGTILFIHAPTAIVRSEDIARVCAPIARNAPGRLMACWLGDSAVANARKVFEDAGIPDYGTPEEAVHALAMLAAYHRNQQQLLETPAASECRPSRPGDARRLIANAIAQGRTQLDERESKALLQAYGIPVVPTLATEPTQQAVMDAAAQVGYPVALKILSPDISHKSDAGGVHLGLENPATLAAAASDMLARLRRALPQARLTGFTVQGMVQRPFAVELILGATVDPLFGPVLLFGQGGTAVEVIADRALALPPLNRTLARELVSRTRVARLLAGYRDHPPARLDAICDALVALSRLVADLPEVAELDINPLWADADGVIALDARVRLSEQPVAGASRFAIAPYPDELTQTVDWQGSPVCLRAIRPEDEPQHRTFVEQLTPQDLHFRFFSWRRVMPRSELARLTQIDYDREMAFIAERTPSDTGVAETLGVARAVIDPDNIEAELGVIVRSDLHGHGLGSLLLDKLIGYLLQRGTRRVVANVLPDNSAMRKLALDKGFVVDPAHRRPDSVRFLKTLRADGQASPATT